MANVRLARAIVPTDVSRSLLTRAQQSFAADYRDTLLLLVRAPSGTDVRAGLESTLSQATQAFLPARQLGYQTQTHEPEAMQALLAAATRGDGGRALADALAAEAHYVVALRKRAGADQILHDRISLGRALNKDIVLRDASVSKLHAWFELHEERAFSVVDAGSTNQTYVNGVALVAKRPFPLSPGDNLRFGSVCAVLTDAEGLWRTIHAAT